jgi:hypothetical protein
METDAGFSNARGATNCLYCLHSYIRAAGWGALGSLAGRFGYAWGRALFYAKGGWAYGGGEERELCGPGCCLPPCSRRDSTVDQLKERLDRRRRHGIRSHGQVVCEGGIHAL